MCKAINTWKSIEFSLFILKTPLRKHIYEWKTNGRNSIGVVEIHHKLRKDYAKTKIALKYLELAIVNIRDKNYDRLVNNRLANVNEQPQYEEQTWAIIQKRLNVEAILNLITFDFEDSTVLLAKSKEVIVGLKGTENKLKILLQSVREKETFRSLVDKDLKIYKSAIDNANAEAHFGEVEKQLVRYQFIVLVLNLLMLIFSVFFFFTKVMSNFSGHLKKLNTILTSVQGGTVEIDILRHIFHLQKDVNIALKKLTLFIYTMERKMFYMYNRFLQMAEKLFNSLANDYKIKFGIIRNGFLCPLMDIVENDSNNDGREDIDSVSVETLDGIHLLICNRSDNEPTTDEYLQQLVRMCMDVTRSLISGRPLIMIDIDDEVSFLVFYWWFFFLTFYLVWTTSCCCEFRTSSRHGTNWDCYVMFR